MVQETEVMLFLLFIICSLIKSGQKFSLIEFPKNKSTDTMFQGYVELSCYTDKTLPVV